MSSLVRHLLDLEAHLSSEKDRQTAIGENVKLTERKIQAYKAALTAAEKKEHADFHAAPSPAPTTPIQAS